MGVRTSEISEASSTSVADTSMPMTPLPSSTTLSLSLSRKTRANKKNNFVHLHHSNCYFNLPVLSCIVNSCLFRKKTFGKDRSKSPLLPATPSSDTSNTKVSSGSNATLSAWKVMAVVVSGSRVRVLSI